jgi:hypothetical protein
VAEVAPEPVREHLDAALAPAAGDDLVPRAFRSHRYVFADDYCGHTVIFRGEIRTENFASPAGLCTVLLNEVVRAGRGDPLKR